MILCDVNVLLTAHREDLDGHERHLNWLRAELESGRAFGVSELVLSSMVRIATNPKVFREPSTTEEAVLFCDEILSVSTAVAIRPGSRHWALFTELCRSAGAKANLVPDAYLAALAIEHGAEWITNDRGFARYPGLRWRGPFDRQR